MLQVKRIFDLLISILLCVVLFPMILNILVLIRFKLGTPFLFKQQRPGIHGIPFCLYKFRTMTNEKDENGNLLPDEVRLTSFGKFLRKYSLDELPQLFNVIRGELSLVGPRPLLMEYLPLYSETEFKRHAVKPGITGWAQVHGRNAVTWDERFKLDLWYVDNQSFWIDCKILLLTFKKVVRSDGVSHANHATMPLFKGGNVVDQ